MEHKQRLEKSIEHTVKESVTKAVKVFFFILLAIAFAFLIGFVVMWLWNWLMPELFGLPKLSYWKALGILLLTKIFFGFGSGGPSKSSSRKKEKRNFKNLQCQSDDKEQSDWRFYDKFWQEEGKEAYQNFVAREKGDGKPQKSEN